MNRKRHIATALVAALLLLAFGSALVAGADEEPPVLSLQKKNVDLGEFMEGEDIEYTFVVGNTGKGELHIVNVRPG